MPRWVGGALGAVLACACGDDSSADGSALRVEAVAPADGATEVDVEAPVVLSFNRDVDPSAADSIEIPGVASDIEIDGATVTLWPREPYGYLEEYEVVVGRGVRDLEGGQLAADHRSSFTTRFRRWQQRVYLGKGIVDPSSSLPPPQLGGLPDGRVVAVWQHGTAGDFVVSWSVYRPDQDSWSPALPLGVSSQPMDPQVASDEAGGLIAVWGDETDVEVARYAPERDEFAVETVHTGGEAVDDVTGAVSGNGYAAVAFVTGTNVQIHHWSLAGGWDSDSFGQGREPAVCIGDDGTVWAAWSSYDGNLVMASVFDGATWSDAAPLWGGADGTVRHLRLARWGGSGAVAAGTAAMADGPDEVHVRFHEFGSWLDDEIVGGGTVAEFEIATLGRGTVLLAWGAASEVHARWWRDGAWQPDAVIAEIDVTDPLRHPIALDGEGNAIILYARDRASYYQAAADTWIESELPIDTDLSRPSFSGSHPVVIGQQPTASGPHIDVTLYR